MSFESDIANQAVSMELQVIKLFGETTWKAISKLSTAAIAGITYVLKKHRQNKDLKPGEINVKKMVDNARRNGVELQEFYIPKNLEKDFAKAVKERGCQVSFIKNKSGESPIYTAVVYPNEANRVDRIIEEMKINNVDTFHNASSVSSQQSQDNIHMNEQSAEDFFEAMNPDEVINEPDPFAQSRTPEDRSGIGSENSRGENIENFDRDSSSERKSVKDRINSIKEARANKAKETPVREDSDKLIDFAEKAKDVKEKAKGREQ